MAILYCKITAETAIKLAEMLHIPAINVYGEVGELHSRPQKIIRWGVGCGIGYTPRLVLNKKISVNNAVDKLKAIEIFNRNEVRTPQFSLEDGIETPPCVGRTREHTQGQNFWLCWEIDQTRTARREGAEYFIKYIPIKQEYRVHVMDGVVKFVQRKYPQDRVSTAFMGIQGFSNGWHKKIFTGTVSRDIKNTAVAAVESLGLDFGGVDILVSLEDGLAYVAEVNTGPSLPTDEVLTPYVNYFRAKLNL